MSGQAWALVWIGVSVVLAVVGAFLVYTSRDSEARHAARSRPSRSSFRGEGEEAPRRKRAAVVLNPVKVEDLDATRQKLAAICARHDWDAPLFLETTEHDVGYGQTRQALDEGVDLVCALGGDGTVRAVGQELIGTGTPFGLLPGGTGNLLARNLLLPVDDLGRAMTIAVTGRNRHIDAAWLTLDPEDTALEIAEHLGESSSAGQRRHAFFVMAGLGLDAAIMDSTSEDLKKRIGWAAYVPSGFKNFLADRFTVTLEIDGGSPETSRARTVVIGNCGKITGGIDLMPDAEPDDGTLDLIVLTPRGITAWAAVAARVITRSERTGADLTRRRCQQAAVQVDEPQRVQVDGDLIGEATRLSVEVQPKALIVRTETGRDTA